LASGCRRSFGGHFGTAWRASGVDPPLVLPDLLKVLVNGGYKQGVIDWGKAMFGYVIEVVKRSELHAFKVLPNAGSSKELLAGSTGIGVYPKAMNTIQKRPRP
jgi:hypothetical protein